MTLTTEQERAEFEAHFKHLDLTQESDAWGVPRYKHDAISLAWQAWKAARRAPVVPQGLFEAIEHGDETHRGWLKSALEAFFSGKPIPQESSTAKHPPAAAPVPQGWKLVPVELLDRATESLGSFISDHGWGQADMDTFDDLSALAADLKGQLLFHTQTPDDGA